MERTKEALKKQTSKIFIGGMLIAIAFFLLGVSSVFSKTVCSTCLTSLTNCEGDFDSDGDVDGSDLAVFDAANGSVCNESYNEYADFDSDGDVDENDLAVFSADFGRTDCSELTDACEGDFDSDGDVDGSDLAVFAVASGSVCNDNYNKNADFDSDGDVDGSDLAVFSADFGRTDCSCQDDTTPPSPPTNISASFGGDYTGIIIGWTTPNDSDFSHVRVYQSNNENVLGELAYDNLSEGMIGETTGLALKIATSGLTLGNTYYYTIRSVDTSGNESTNTDQYPVTLVKEAKNSIMVTSPNGGERWEVEKPYTIKWNSTGYDKVRIYVGCEGYSSGAIMDVPSGATGGSYVYTVPANWAAQDQCKVQVSENLSMLTNITDGVNSDMSDDYFSIVKFDNSTNKSITVISPNGEEELKIGEQYLIEWSTTGDVNQVTVALNKSGVYVKNLIWNINNHGSISWTPDLSLEPGDDYKIRITDPDNGVYDESDNYFSITKSSEFTCLPDGTLLKLPNDPKIYVIIDCEIHWIRTAKEFEQKGYKWENVKISTSDVINSFPEVFESGQNIKEGALIRTKGGVDIYIVKYIGNKKFIRLILNPSVFNSYGHLKWEDVIEVEEGTINSFTISDLVRNAETGRIYRLTANGDSGIRRHFKSISVMQRLGYDLDAVYEINEIDESSYEEGDGLE